MANNTPGRYSINSLERPFNIPKNTKIIKEITKTRSHLKQVRNSDADMAMEVLRRIVVDIIQRHRYKSQLNTQGLLEIHKQLKLFFFDDPSRCPRGEYPNCSLHLLPVNQQLSQRKKNKIHYSQICLFFFSPLLFPLIN